MSHQPRTAVQYILIFLCVLLSLDLGIRLFSGSPVEATRISGRETDAAFTSLSSANMNLSQSNLRLAASIDRLSTELHSLDLDKWAKSEEAVAKAQEGLAKSSELLASALARACDVLKAMGGNAPQAGAAGENEESPKEPEQQ